MDGFPRAAGFAHTLPCLYESIFVIETSDSSPDLPAPERHLGRNCRISLNKIPLGV
jgi:hypothetical protein